MKLALPCVALLISMGAIAGPDARMCEMMGSMARVITQDRDLGATYKAEIAKMKAASVGVSGGAGILKLSTSIVNVVYKELPHITPEAAERLHYGVCMAQP